MTGKSRIRTALNHTPPDRLAIDFGSTAVTGMHVTCVAALREHYGLEARPVKVCEPYQMLGEIEDDLLDAMGVDTVAMPGPGTLFGFRNENWKAFRAPWGQELLVAERFNITQDARGDLFIYPEGDTSVPPSGRMPSGGFFFDTIIRQPPLDDNHLDPEDNLEEFKPLSDDQLQFYAMQAKRLALSDRAVVGGIGGTAFGTQTSSFCSTDTYDELYAPYYKRINAWVHAHTPWKTFKHSCGAVAPFIPHFIASGFDIVNPVQCSAAGMDPRLLKERYGDRITFWGGGVDTQKTLPFGTPAQVRQEVLTRCDIFAPDGGFVFNAIHNVQARTPVENIVAMIDAVREFNGEK